MSTDHDQARRATGEISPSDRASGTGTDGKKAGKSGGKTLGKTSGAARVGLATSRPPGRWQHRTRPPRPRGLLVLAVLLVVGFGLTTAYMVTRAGDRVSALALGAPVAKGQILERADLVSQAVSGIPGAVEVASVNEVVGQTATVDLLAGQVLTADMLTSVPIPARGQAAVGLALDPTRVPSAGLAPGDVVDVIAVPNIQSANGANAAGRVGLDRPTVLARGASVYAVQGAAVEAGQVLLTLVVDQSESKRVAAYSTSGRVAVVEVAATAVTTGTASGAAAGSAVDGAEVD